MKATLLISRRVPFADGSFVAFKVWRVPPSRRTPEGMKYGFAYINKDGKRVLGYDNSDGKGHHRHDGPVETPIVFTGVDDLMNRFLAEVKERRRTQP